MPTGFTKHDGYRLIVQRDGKRVRLFTRNGHDWSDRHPLITEAALRNRISSFVIDGEAVLLGVDGQSDFDGLHSRKHNDVQFYAFDVLSMQGEDLRQLPLHLRKNNLARLPARRIDGIFLSDFEQGEIDAMLTKALSISPRHARGHLYLGALQCWTKRAAQGIRECEQALSLDRNLADAHGVIGSAKVLIGRGSETESTEAFRLSPLDPIAFRWMFYAGMTKLILGADNEAVVWLRRCLEANRNYPIAHFQLAAALALIGSLEEAQASVRAGLELDPTFNIRRTRGRMSDDPTFVAGSKRVREGMRMAGALRACR